MDSASLLWFTGCVITNGMVIHATEQFAAQDVDDAYVQLLSDARAFAAAAGIAFDPRNISTALRRVLPPSACPAIKEKI